MRAFTGIVLFLTVAVVIGCNVVNSSPATDLAESPPTPAAESRPASKNLETAVFAGGCFWGVEGVFEHVKGVTNVVSGYAGGDAKFPSYDNVSGGSTGHAESVKVTFDSTKVTYIQLLS